MDKVGECRRARVLHAGGPRAESRHRNVCGLVASGPFWLVVLRRRATALAEANKFSVRLPTVRQHCFEVLGRVGLPRGEWDNCDECKRDPASFLARTGNCC